MCRSTRRETCSPFSKACGASGWIDVPPQGAWFPDALVGRMANLRHTDFVVHAGHTGDFFPHHMGAEFMRRSPFRQRIAHGATVFAIGGGLTATLISPFAFSSGYDKLRFLRPVFIGDTTHARVTIAARESAPAAPPRVASSSGAQSSTRGTKSCPPPTISCSSNGATARF